MLLSSVTAGLFGSGGDVTLHDLGTHHLKDLAEPEHVFELRHPDLPIVNRKIVTLDVDPAFALAWAPATSVTLEMIGTSRTISCVIAPEVLRQFRPPCERVGAASPIPPRALE